MTIPNETPQTIYTIELFPRLGSWDEGEARYIAVNLANRQSNLGFVAQLRSTEDGTGQHRDDEPKQGFTGCEDDLADALRRTLAERDALAAKLEKVREWAEAASKLTSPSTPSTQLRFCGNGVLAIINANKREG